MHSMRVSENTTDISRTVPENCGEQKKYDCRFLELLPLMNKNQRRTNNLISLLQKSKQVPSPQGGGVYFKDFCKSIIYHVLSTSSSNSYLTEV